MQYFKGRFYLGSSEGFGIIEVLIGLTLVSMASMVSIAFIQYSQSEIKKQEALIGRNTELEQFFTMLNNPFYVGALASYPENVDLKKCISNEGTLCSISEVYPLTNYDLVTKEPVSHLTTLGSDLVTTELSFKVHCPMDQSSCEEADYINITIKTSRVDSSGKSYSQEKVVMVQPVISNVVTYIPNTQVEMGRSLNLIIFLDSSNSMLPVKDQVISALRNLVDQLKYMDVKVAFYSVDHNSKSTDTSGNYQIDGAGNRVPVVFPLSDGSIYYSDWAQNYVYENYNVSATKNIFEFSASLTSTQRDSLEASMKLYLDKRFEILSQSNIDGTLCGLSRILRDSKGLNSYFNLNDKNPTVTMVISNEDDGSVLLGVGDTVDENRLNHCYVNMTNKCTYRTTENTYISYKRQYCSGSFTATGYSDGVPTPQRFGNAVPVKFDAYFSEGSDCSGVLSSYVKANGYPDATDVSATYATLSLYEFGVNCGASLAIGLEGYVPGSCVEATSTSSYAYCNSSVSEPVITTDNPAYATRDMTAAVSNLLKTTFANSNFFYIPIINPSSGVCPATTGSAVGSRYEDIAASLGPERSQVVPLCSSDYGSKLQSLHTYLSTLGLGDFKLAPLVAQNMTGIEVDRGGTILLPQAGTDYSLSGEILIFREGYIQPTDVIKVYTK